MLGGSPSGCAGDADEGAGPARISGLTCCVGDRRRGSPKRRCHRISRRSPTRDPPNCPTRAAGVPRRRVPLPEPARDRVERGTRRARRRARHRSARPPAPGPARRDRARHPARRAVALVGPDSAGVCRLPLSAAVDGLLRAAAGLRAAGRRGAFRRVRRRRRDRCRSSTSRSDATSCCCSRTAWSRSSFRSGRWPASTPASASPSCATGGTYQAVAFRRSKTGSPGCGPRTSRPWTGFPGPSRIY